MKKLLIIVIGIISITGIAFYLKIQSSYEFVKNEIGLEENRLNFQEETLQNNEGLQLEEEISQNKEEPLEEVFQRSEEDIAMDKRIKEHRLKNEEMYKKHGVSGSLESGKGFAPKRTYEENYQNAVAINSIIKEYVNSNTEVYHEYNELELTGNSTVDPRFEELIWGKPKEERKGLLKGHNDEDMTMVEVKKLDGEYDEVFLVRDPDTRKWSIEYVGNYYDFKEKVEENE